MCEMAATMVCQQVLAAAKTAKAFVLDSAGVVISRNG